jgi:thermolysin
VSTGFVTADDLRPPVLDTFTLRGNPFALEAFLNGRRSLSQSDYVSDFDNSWTDGAAVDAHVHAGWTYDYLFKRFGRHGLDDRGLPILNIVHPVNRSDTTLYFDGFSDLFVNAFYAGDGVMVYGEGLPAALTFDGQSVDYLAGALDVVAHEFAHGVTDYTSRLEYEGESGALNEAFSDIIATSVEWFFQSAGAGRGQADYLIGEDVFLPGGFRSMSDPARFGNPDHYSDRFTGPEDDGGVHINSSIPNQAFYLAIEGGRNATSGLSVSGVGGANREQIERVFYRAFTSMLPARATFSTARAATIQSARDLYGASSAVERAVMQAWTAVGVL